MNPMQLAQTAADLGVDSRYIEAFVTDVSNNPPDSQIYITAMRLLKSKSKFAAEDFDRKAKEMGFWG